ncbi:MAG: radical SAM family heme chaperone HemW [Methylococcaceae bacterium]|nr:radical SAM family heme chaperone HemW [Methylococcaceae bacterium]MDZ4154934.1 radical SAM family heme chaperone HemW [Methylococcales bacterium]MDP2392439.1 radical SAM family heme chaperone HemW [Methylococcaceae bacterium]MDP3019545.1 radical SAM family heme chaperone HemW [Methylococcaceae bacterium]MDP3388926.1 radical SAM family heme chaperone HemW [Methylococcaceae bacterium]
MPPLSLYIHIPWCIKKCPYCDFNSHAVKSDTPESAYIDALLEDLACDVQRYQITRPISSIFIGGGTPSLFSPESFERLLTGIAQQVTLEDGLEITLEANPGTFESQKFAEFRSLGFNRLSIGIQSFKDALLKNLGRVHSGKEALLAGEIAHQAGFENFNLDLMFGLPGARPDDSLTDIATAINLNPTHISFYQLTLEPNTYFHKFPPKLPNDESIFATQKACQQLLAEHDYQQYEVSAYSQPGRQCRHNLNYWQFGDYLGIGAGAHGKISMGLPGQIVRTHKARSPEQYLNAIDKLAGAETISTLDLPLEFMMNHLRLKSGFSLATYQASSGLEATTLEPALTACVRQGLLVQQNNHYYCSEQGWNFLDDILQKFVI